MTKTIELNNNLPNLLFPALERQIIKPKECLGELYGKKTDNSYIITNVFFYSLNHATKKGVSDHEAKEDAQIKKNIESILDKEIMHLGDIHTHISWSPITRAYKETKPKKFIQQFLEGAVYSEGTDNSEGDLELMQKDKLYLIMSFGEKKFNHRKRIIKPDKKSIYGRLQDFVFCITAWYYEENKFVKGKIKI